MLALGGAAEEGLLTVNAHGFNVLHWAASKSVKSISKGMPDVAKAVLAWATDEAAAGLLSATTKASHCILFHVLHLA